MRIKILVVFILASMLGSLLGLASHHLFFSSFEAVAIVKLAKFPTPKVNFSSSNEAADFQQTAAIIIEKMRSPNFAKLVSERLKRPGLAVDLTPRTFGGRGLLTVRQLRDAGAIEIKVRGATEIDALATVKAVSDQVIDDQRLAIEPMITFMESQLNQIDAERSAVSERFRTFSNSGQSAQIVDIISDQINNLRVAEFELRSLIYRAKSDSAQLILISPIQATFISSVLIAMLAGAVVGFAGCSFFYYFYKVLTSDNGEHDDMEFDLSNLNIRVRNSAGSSIVITDKNTQI